MGFFLRLQCNSISSPHVQSLPRVDALGSRQFLMNLLPRLCKVPSALRKLDTPSEPSRRRALDVGGGVGRTTKDVLLHLVDDVVLVEPVNKFLLTAKNDSNGWKGIANNEKSVTFVEAPLQILDPLDITKDTVVLGCSGARPETDRGYFDTIWCQWCLGHLSDQDLIAFFKRAKGALNPVADSLIVVKENLCRDGQDGSPRSVFDRDDSSLTRSNAMWLQIFEQAGLQVIDQKVQNGLPAELYKVKMYALR